MLNTPAPAPQFDISNEDHRTYLYLNGGSLKVEGPKLLTIYGHTSAEVHLIQTANAGESIVIAPGWNAIKIQQHVLAPLVEVPDYGLPDVERNAEEL